MCIDDQSVSESPSPGSPAGRTIRAGLMVAT